jgi:hypothetical protein
MQESKNVNETGNQRWVGEQRSRVSRRSHAKLWIAVGIAIAVVATAWLAYSYRQSDAAASKPAASTASRYIGFSEADEILMTVNSTRLSRQPSVSQMTVLRSLPAPSECCVNIRCNSLRVVCCAGDCLDDPLVELT